MEIQFGTVHSVDVAEMKSIRTEAQVLRGATGGHDNGGIPMRMTNGARAYFKPCFGLTQTDSFESYGKEVMTFFFDRLMGYYRTPPVTIRVFQVVELEELVKQEPDQDLVLQGLTYLDLMVEYCGSPDGKEIEGALVSWAPFMPTLMKKRWYVNDHEKTWYSRIPTVSATIGRVPVPDVSRAGEFFHST
jgi:hypothetical protein